MLKRYRFFMVIFLLGFTLSFIINEYVKTEHGKADEIRFTQLAEARFISFNRVLDNEFNSLKFLANSLQSHEEITESIFRGFSRALLNAHSEIKALAWLPKVSLPKEKQYLVNVVEPLIGNEEYIAYDFSKDLQIKEDMVASALSNKVIITAPVELDKGEKSSLGVYVIAPIYKKNTESVFSEYLEEDVKGFVFMFLNMKEFLDYANSEAFDTYGDGLVIELEDKTAGVTLSSFNNEGSESHLANHYYLEEIIDTGRGVELFSIEDSRLWQLMAKAPDHFGEKTDVFEQNIALILGCIFSLIIAFGLNIQRQQTQQIKSQVIQRGKDLGISITKSKEAVEARKEAERERLKAEEAVQSKNEFLANMSHEVRTPMNAIIGMSHLALLTSLTRKQEDYVTKIHKAANSLLVIINDILDFSKIDAGKLVMEKIPFQLTDVLTNLAHLMSTNANEKGIELLIKQNINFTHKLVGDPLRLGQILINLTNNAIKFTEEGEIIIEVDSLYEESNDVTLQFSIIDSGIGMTSDELDNLFKSFSQADSSITRKYGGTGLGLTICKQLTELMGGEISVSSKKDEGTRFTFTAQFLLSDEENDDNPQLLSTDTLYGSSVLIVDDNNAARDILMHLAKSLSFNVELASSGEEALEMIKKSDESNSPYDLLLLDWKMPGGIDGLETSRQIKSDVTLKSTPKIIIISAYDKESLLSSSTDTEIDGFLSKPVNASTLLDATMQVYGLKESVKTEDHMSEMGLEYVANIKGANILLVEDNAVNQQIAIELLEMAQLIVTVAENGQKGVEAANTGQYDAVLMDIQMPVMDGLTATREIKKNPQLKELPIIAMTANAMSGDRESCIESGMVDHVSKPINPKKLFQTLSLWIKPVKREFSKAVPNLNAVSDVQSIQSKKLNVPIFNLPGFDFKEAIKRMGGNESTYIKILKQFIDTESDAFERLKTCLKSHDMKQVKRIVHTLKGIAGAIGAEDLYQIMTSFEKAIIDGSSIDHFILTSEKSFCETIAIINVALKETNAP